jgi:hypothetical protein
MKSGHLQRLPQKYAARQKPTFIFNDGIEEYFEEKTSIPSADSREAHLLK